MKVMLTGADGQLGRELQQCLPVGIELIPCNRKALDLVEAGAIEFFVQAHKPALIINAAAYTAVDRAETESELAHRVNAEAAGQLAAAAAATGAGLVQISTDFVFPGTQVRPYRPDDPTQAINAYGASKLAGEELVRKHLGAHALILRTAWLYSAHGHNFVKTVLRLLRERKEVNIVADQVGTPTWAGSLAQAIWQAVDRGLRGSHHWTDAGVASWYDFASAVRELALEAGLLQAAGIIRPIRTEDYPTPAQRPAFSVLDKTATWQALGLESDHWRSCLATMLEQLKQQDG